MAEKQYTRQAQEALNMARKIAAELKHPYVGTEHLLFGLKRVFTGVAGQVLDKNKVDEEPNIFCLQCLKMEIVWLPVC